MTTRAQVAELHKEFGYHLFDYYAEKGEAHKDRRVPINTCSHGEKPFEIFLEQLGLNSEYKETVSRGHLASHYRGQVEYFYFPCYMTFAVGTQYISPSKFLEFVVAASFSLRYQDRVVCCSVSSSEDKHYAAWVKFASEYEGAVITTFTRMSGTKVSHLYFPVLLAEQDFQVKQGKHPT